jgi:uncharacterized repeat protein (TIGR03843 family)
VVLIQNKEKVLKALEEGELSISGQFMHSSNYTFLVQVGNGNKKFPAVYKPQKGETPLWDFPAGTLCQREVAAFIISEALGWELVPPTVFRKKAPLGKGALQLFVEHDPELHYFSFEEKTRQRLKPTVLFDLIINNADRKGGHILKDGNGHLWLIDHGTCFHQEFKLRSVIWEFVGHKIPQNFQADIQRLGRAIEEDEIFRNKLSSLITAAEIHALQTRIKILVQLNTFPFPEKNRRTIPWPPL